MRFEVKIDHSDPDPRLREELKSYLEDDVVHLIYERLVDWYGCESDITDIEVEINEVK